MSFGDVRKPFFFGGMATVIEFLFIFVKLAIVRQGLTTAQPSWLIESNEMSFALIT
jgi:hypothetical protein